MFPKIGRGIADLQFVYLHCEIELMPKGFAPTCDDSAFGRAIKTNINAGKFVTRDSIELGRRLKFNIAGDA